MIMIRRMLSAPLFWFLLTGALLFLLDGIQLERKSNTITITKGDIQRLRDQWLAQSGVPVTPDMLGALTTELIQERRLALEAVALGLDQEDVIIRRRLAQKLKFVTYGLADGIAPTRSELEAFFEQQRELYNEPAKMSFSQIFFSIERRGDNAANDATASLSELRQQPGMDRRDMGDPFMLGSEFQERAIPELGQLFGSAFVERLATQRPGGWQGPFASAFGLHLVSIERHTPSRTVELDKVRERVLYDYREARRHTAYQQYLAELAKKYPVVLESTALIQTQNASVTMAAP